jgi:hypothetical protein
MELAKSCRRAARALRPWSTALPLLLAALSPASPAHAAGQCTVITDELLKPAGSALTPLGSLLVAESGTRAPNTGRLSIVGRDGLRRTLLDGLPSGIADVGDVSGPSGMALRGRTLYLLNSVGDVGIAGPAGGTVLPNPAGPSSPLMSSLIAVHFSAAAETSGASFSLTPDDHQRIAAGETVALDGPGGGLSVRLVADFPNSIPFPLPFLPQNLKLSNPFGVALMGELAFVTDGGRNLVWRVELASGAVEPLVEFPNIPNPLFGVPGLPPLPTTEAVPTGIAAADDRLLVALFRGAPFAPGTSTVQRVHPVTGADELLIGGMKTLIDVLPLGGDRGLLVLQHASAPAPFFAGPGRVLHYRDPALPPEVVADCLERPVAMTLDRREDRLLVTDFSGRLLAVPFRP